MSYCEVCNSQKSTVVHGVCQECGFDFFDELMLAERALRAVQSAKKKGWTIYPNVPEWGDPIDDVLTEYEQRVSDLKK